MIVTKCIKIGSINSFLLMVDKTMLIRLNALFRFFAVIVISSLLLVGCGDDSESESTDSQASQQPSDAAVVANATSSGDFEKPDYKDDPTAFRVLSMHAGTYDDAPAIQVNFSIPVKKVSNLGRWFRVSVSDEPVKGGWILSKDQRKAYFPYVQSDTRYRVDSLKWLEAKNGKLLKHEWSKNIQIHDIQPKVRFAKKGGTILPKSRQLPIKAVNVEKVDIKFWRVKPDQYDEVFYSNSRYYSNSNSSGFQDYGDYDLRYLKKVADLVYTGQLELDAKPNQQLVHNINLKKIDALKDNGLYLAVIKNANDYSDYSTNWFMISNIGVHTRQYQDSLVVFTHNVDNSNAYSNVELTLLDRKSNAFFDIKTDSSGFAEIPAEYLDDAVTLIAKHGVNTNVMNLRGSKLDLSEFELSKRYQKDLEFFLYSARDMYRPGEKVVINGLLRDQDGVFEKTLPVNVKIIKADGKEYQSFAWNGDEQAFYSKGFVLPHDAARGLWKYQVRFADSFFEYPFSVEDFLPERLSLELEFSSEHISADDLATVNIQGDYLYGAPASKNRFDGVLNVSTATKLFDDEKFKGYFFGSNDYKHYNQKMDVSTGYLDDKGAANFEITGNWEDTKFPLQLKTYVNVYESGGRPISRSTKQFIWPKEFAVGIRPQWLSNNRDYAYPEQSNTVELLAVNKKGERLELKNLTAVLIRKDFKRYWHWGDDGWGYANSEKDIEVFNQRFNISDSGRVKLDLPLDYGNYQLIIKDDSSVISEHHFFAGWEWSENNQNGERPDQVAITLKSDNITKGKPINLHIKAPYKGTAVVTLETDGLVWSKSFELKSNEFDVEIPYPQGVNQHNLYATAMVIKGADVKRKILPERSFGLLHLPLNRSNRKLELAIEHPEKLLPEQEFEVLINNGNSQSKEDVYVTLALVDTGVLNISNFQTPDAGEWFFAQRAYEPRLLDNYGNFIQPMDGKKAKQRFGGDEDLSRGGDAPLSDVQIVSIVSDKIKLDGTGKAKEKVKLPYFNGELRLMALAFSDDRFGSAESKVKVAAPVVLQSSLPRFLAYSDSSEVVLDLTSMEEHEQKIDFELSADASLGGETLKKTITLAPKSKQIVKIPVTAKSQMGKGQIFLQAKVTSKTRDPYDVNRSWGIGFRAVSPAYTKQISKLINKNTAFDVAKSFTDEYSTSGLKTVVTVSTKPPINASEYLQGLLQYPYGCLEQTTSRAWPLLMLEEGDLTTFKLDDKKGLLESRKSLIDKAISRVLSMQRYNGSFALWDARGVEERWLTVYVTDFLLKAKELGYQFSDNALTSAVSKLRDYTRNMRLRDSRNFDNDEYYRWKHYELSYRAYAAYVLSKINKVNLQDVRKLADDFSSYAESPLALAQLAMALENMGDEKRAKETWSKVQTLANKRRERAYYGDYGSDVRDLAQVSQLMLDSKVLKNQKEDPFMFMNDLVKKLDKRSYLSTQEKGSLFRMARDFNNYSSKANWNLSINQQSVQQSNDYVKSYYGDDAREGFSFVNSDESVVYINVKSQGYAKNNNLSVSDGIDLKRRYYDMSGSPREVKTLKSGDRYLVRISARAQKEHSHLADVMLVDLLPAGVEVENQNLENSFDISEIKVDGKTIRQWHEKSNVIHAEFWDDRFMAVVPLTDHKTTELFYMVRAVSPGEYTIPSSFAEDMYRPEIRAIGKAEGRLIIKPAQ